MDKFTEKLPDGRSVIKKEYSFTTNSKYGSFIEGPAVEKLADYEKAEEKGLLLKLPCAINSTVYDICTFFDGNREKCHGCAYYHEKDKNKFIDPARCDYIDENGNKKNNKCLIVVEQKATLPFIDICFDLNLFGNTVFLTREEAEQKLRELQNMG